MREKRGLAYGVSDSLVWFERAAVVIGGTATRADRAAETLAIIEREIKRMAEERPDRGGAGQGEVLSSRAPTRSRSTPRPRSPASWSQIQLDNLGIDYIERRNALIDAVTLDDAKRVAKRLLGGGMLVTVVGRPQGRDVEPSDAVSRPLAASVRCGLRLAAA